MDSIQQEISQGYTNHKLWSKTESDRNCKSDPDMQSVTDLP